LDLRNTFKGDKSSDVYVPRNGDGGKLSEDMAWRDEGQKISAPRSGPEVVLRDKSRRSYQGTSVLHNFAPREEGNMADSRAKGLGSNAAPRSRLSTSVWEQNLTKNSEPQPQMRKDLGSVKIRNIQSYYEPSREGGVSAKNVRGPSSGNGLTTGANLESRFTRDMGEPKKPIVWERKGREYNFTVDTSNLITNSNALPSVKEDILRQLESSHRTSITQPSEPNPSRPQPSGAVHEVQVLPCHTKSDPTADNFSVKPEYQSSQVIVLSAVKSEPLPRHEITFSVVPSTVLKQNIDLKTSVRDESFHDSAETDRNVLGVVLDKDLKESHSSSEQNEPKDNEDVRSGLEVKRFGERMSPSSNSHQALVVETDIDSFQSSREQKTSEESNVSPGLMRDNVSMRYSLDKTDTSPRYVSDKFDASSRYSTDKSDMSPRYEVDKLDTSPRYSFVTSDTSPKMPVDKTDVSPRYSMETSSHFDDAHQSEVKPSLKDKEDDLPIVKPKREPPQVKPKPEAPKTKPRPDPPPKTAAKSRPMSHVDQLDSAFVSALRSHGDRSFCRPDPALDPGLGPGLDLDSSVSTSHLLDISLSKSKGRLSNTGSIALRRRPTFRASVIPISDDTDADIDTDNCRDREKHTDTERLTQPGLSYVTKPLTNGASTSVAAMPEIKPLVNEAITSRPSIPEVKLFSNVDDSSGSNVYGVKCLSNGDVMKDKAMFSDDITHSTSLTSSSRGFHSDLDLVGEVRLVGPSADDVDSSVSSTRSPDERMHDELDKRLMNKSDESSSVSDQQGTFDEAKFFTEETATDLGPPLDLPPPLPSCPPPDLNLDSLPSDSPQGAGVAGSTPTSSREDMMRRKYEFLGLKTSDSQEYSILVNGGTETLPVTGSSDV